MVSLEMQAGEIRVDVRGPNVAGTYNVFVYEHMKGGLMMAGSMTQKQIEQLRDGLTAALEEER